MYERILAIGDIHGEWAKFQSLYEQIAFDPKRDLLIFLGDYVDRGPEPCKVLDWMMEHQHRENIVVLRGNHEQMMLEDLRMFQEDFTWWSNGGNVTLKKMKEKAEVEPRIRDIYREFLETLPYSHRVDQGGKTYFFCHAGVQPGIPLEEQSPDTLLWIREDYFGHYQGDAIVVTGHTPVCYLRPGCYTPIQHGNMILMDTGSFMREGRVSCIDVLSRNVWQSRSVAVPDADTSVTSFTQRLRDWLNRRKKKLEHEEE